MMKSTVIVCRYFGVVFLASLSLLYSITPKLRLVSFPSTSSLQVNIDREYVQVANIEPAIKNINLIGERHSGTKWITSHLEDCFGDQAEVLDRYTRYKHWFQYEDPTLYPENSTVVVALFRDPYDWLESMRKKPYHSPNHFDLNWKTFLTRPWGMERGPADKKLIEDGLAHNTTCMHRFPFENIIPCSKLDRNMYKNAKQNGKKIGVNYELNQDGSGSPYASILQLRSYKIQNFLSLSGFYAVHSFYPVQFEFMVSHGTSELINELEKVTGFKAKCQRQVPRPIREKEYDPIYLQWVNEHLDWETEKLVGYSPRKLHAE